MTDQLMTDNGSADQMWSSTRLATSEQVSRGMPRYEKLWAYYRNPIELVRSSGLASGVGSTRGWYRSAQEVGLPSRIVGSGTPGTLGSERGRREVVIENDIGWRVGAMVDFMFGSPIRIESLARDEGTREKIEEVLERVWEGSGGIAMLQDMATLGHVFGHVDLLVRVDEERLVGSRLLDADEWISIEPIDARRGAAVLSEHDYRQIEGYGVFAARAGVDERMPERPGSRKGWLDRLRSGERGERASKDRKKTSVAGEVFTREGWARFVDDELVESGAWSLLPGVVPVVHMQNMSQPFVYGGIGEVEALVGLQDELNTRLSDRASRVTMQSFKS